MYIYIKYTYIFFQCEEDYIKNKKIKKIKKKKIIKKKK